MSDAQSLIELIPRLRRYARALVGERAAADDLVQDTLERAWSKLHLYRHGTDLRAWLFTVMHNVHVNRVRGEPGLQFRAPALVEPAVRPGLQFRFADRWLVAHFTTCNLVPPFPCNSTRSFSRARASLDITVPIGIPSARAVSS